MFREDLALANTKSHMTQRALPYITCRYIVNCMFMEDLALVKAKFAEAVGNKESYKKMPHAREVHPNHNPDHKPNPNPDHNANSSPSRGGRQQGALQEDTAREGGSP